MLKKITLGLVFSIFFNFNAVAEESLFDESYSDEQIRIEIEKKAKRVEIIPPEEIARIENDQKKTRDRFVDNSSEIELKNFVNLVNYLNKETKENYQNVDINVKDKDQVKAFYDKNFTKSVAEMVESENISSN